MDRVPIRRSFPLTKSLFSEVKDLQLAAELGRSLLERNEELETELKAQHGINEDQAQEIEFLSKQLSSMKEEALGRTKLYEQLETTLYDLERTNSQLSRKREVDKNRIQRMGENIDYLERKCEELSGTLETFRDTTKKRLNPAKIHGDYFGFTGSSDSSEDDNGYGYSRRRSQSLHDLRDYTSSPEDDFDSSHSHSNSPDLKTSENEFIQTLEARVEELIGSKKKETNKITQLEAQLRILIQENANLQQQLSTVTVEKEEQLSELRKQILDQSFTSSLDDPSCPVPDLSSPVTPISITLNGSSRSLHGFRTPSSTRAYKTGDNRLPDHGAHGGPPHSSICKRCSVEINLLNLVNSIEFENEDYSSLEYELARANLHDGSSSGSPPHQQLPLPSLLTSPPSKQGFLDHFFGTNSILKKIRMRSQECLLLDDEEGGQDGLFEEEEEVELPKDLGPEKFQKSCDSPEVMEVMPKVNQEHEVVRRKLRLPDRIPDQDTAISIRSTASSPALGCISGFDESLCDPAQVTVGIKRRSKLWWLVWLVLMVLGSVQVIWSAVRLVFWFLLASVLPKCSGPSLRPTSLCSGPTAPTPSLSRHKLLPHLLPSSRKLL